MIVVPDEILETMNCDNCHKFLSVPPVKKYPDGRRKCGRCCRRDENGIVCDYGLFAAQGLFKCVNRFDGCRRLLGFAQSYHHEFWCRSRTYPCPVCPQLCVIPTFYMVEHFRNDHEEYLLKTNTFRIELATASCKTYLYRVEDNLFYIEYRMLALDTFGFKATFLGSKGCERMTTKFTVQFGDERIETETKPTYSIGDVKHSDAFVMKTRVKPRGSGIVTVHLDLGDLEAVLASSSTILFPRRVTVLEAGNMAITANAASLFVHTLGSIQKLTMYCVGCKVVPDGQWNFVQVHQNWFHYVCDPCQGYGSLGFPSSKVIPAGALFPELHRVKIGFACVWSEWGCMDVIHQLNGLEKHEAACPYQPLQVCPVPDSPDCLYFGDLLALKKHFSSEHPTVSLYLKRTLLELELKPSSTPTPTLFIIWADYGFISIEISPDTENDRCTIGLRQPKALEPRGALSPMLIIIADPYESPLVMKSGSVSLKIGTFVKCTCFFFNE